MIVAELLTFVFKCLYVVVFSVALCYRTLIVFCCPGGGK